MITKQLADRLDRYPLATRDAQDVKRILCNLIYQDDSSGPLDTQVELACALLARMEQGK